MKPSWKSHNKEERENKKRNLFIFWCIYLSKESRLGFVMASIFKSLSIRQMWEKQDILAAIERPEPSESEYVRESVNERTMKAATLNNKLGFISINIELTHLKSAFRVSQVTNKKIIFNKYWMLLKINSDQKTIILRQNGHKIYS